MIYSTGSGLTRKQRSLVIIVIVLLLYIAFGALVNSLIMDLTFINGLYFTTVTLETIGFGDIVPTTTGARVFTCCYMVFGILNIGVAVTMCRETVLEGLEVGYRKRWKKLRKRRREARRFRRWELRWQRAVEWRLKSLGLPVWVHDRHYEHEGVKFTGLTPELDGTGEDHWTRKWLESIGLMKAKGPTSDAKGRRHIRGHPKNKHLNFDALSSQQLEATALEAGVPLDMFMDPGRPTVKRHSTDDSQGPHAGLNVAQSHLGVGLGLHRTASSSGWPSHPQTPTHAQIGRMAAMITKFAVTVTGTHVRMMGHAADGQVDPEEHRRVQIEEAEDAEEAEEDAEDAVSPGPKQGSSVWFDENTEREREVGEQSDRGQPVEQDNSADPGLVDVGMHAPAPRWAREIARSSNERSAFLYEHYTDDIATEERRAYYAKVCSSVLGSFCFESR